MPRRLLALLAAVALLGACSPKGHLAPDLPPETTLFVQGPVDTVNHIAHLYWFGTDVDGTVQGFEIRFLNPAAPAETTWTFTTRSDSLFKVYTPAGYTAPVFEVRAVDDAGLRDETPASENFSFSNRAPTVAFTSRFRTTDTTFASATATWTATDPDGDVGALRFRIWLDGRADQPNLVTGTRFTFPSEQFQQDGTYTSGFRRMFIQAIDDGGRASVVDSASWYVRSPGTGGRTHPARLLIVDDTPAGMPGNRNTDSLYANTAARNLPAGSWSVLRLADSTALSARPFRSSKDVEQTLGLFDAVVWYVGGFSSFATFEPRLLAFQDGIGAYLDAGGNFYLDGLNLIDAHLADGPLSADFASRYLDTGGFMQHFEVSLGDSTAGWGAGNGAVFRYVAGAGDSLRMSQLPADGLRGFVVRNPADVLMVAPAHSLPADNPVDMPIAVAVPQPSGGIAVVVSFPMRLADGTAATEPSRTAARVLARIFQLLGATGP